VIDFVLFAVIFWIVVVMVASVSEDANRQVDTLLELDAEHKARVDAEMEIETHLRTIRYLQYELDQRNGWAAGPLDDILAPYAPPVGLTLMEEYQPHVIEWLPFSLN
jgi:hypothetical protein